ncbi:hypothetical protein BB560_005020 [Smittium megazygosporum]|uniref:Large ribosomal subunit protein mL49 n=1 Tax=Smittium megazygosporum TaxID=133381 RepID=A0A2T9Z7M7_9FUNG|nr:hypothetical protein BB560_005020 [Smittium megazygosporum]
MFISRLQNTFVTGPFLRFPTAVATRSLSVSSLAPLRYHVNRTQFKSLPVYTEFRNNGTRKLTLVRRIEGDIEQLKSELEPIVGKENISMKKINNSLVIKGIFLREIRAYLQKRGF